MKKFLATITAAVMLFGSGGIFGGVDIPTQMLKASAEIIENGSFGENVYWQLNDEGILTVTGTGEMRNYGNYSSPIWGNSRIKKAIINEGVTSIGAGAFEDCRNLKSVVLSPSVISIGRAAFERCDNLENIEIPQSVSFIGDDAFGCTKWLENMQSINSFVIVNGILIDGRTCEGDVIIPDDVSFIGDWAFYGSGVKKVKIPNGVKRIGESSFRDCRNLISVSIPDNVSYIGDDDITVLRELI